MEKKSIIILIIIIINIFLLFTFSISFAFIRNEQKKDIDFIIKDSLTISTKELDEVEVIISALGDCTIGYDDNFGYSKSFNEVYDLNGYDYFFSNVKSVFDNDDLTVANLEGTFTDATLKREKAFNFKAPPHYVNILKSGSIEVVNIANNHIYDYNDIGYLDTINTLNDANINYFGFDDIYIYTKDNIKIGFAGIYCIEDRGCTKEIDKSIKSLKSMNVNTIILSFHWGIEKSYSQSDIQTYLAHYAIDNGVELVLGHHPHVLQGIELYKDKYIVYSLANFSFGGNKNPSDKDSMIFQIYFNYIKGVLNDTTIKVYPTSVSSLRNINDYRPTLLTDSEYDRVMKKIEKNSIGIKLT